MSNSTFSIDFFELAFLAEACIPPRPIARTLFWQSLTNKYWHQMTEHERSKLFDWLQKNWTYEESLKEQEDTQIFHARFDPNNQYEVTYEFNNEKGTERAFLYKDNYYKSTTSYINPDYITRVTKLDLTYENIV